MNYERLSKELTEKAKKDLAKPILEDIGVDITEDIEYPNYGFILCELNKDQLSKAEKNDIIKSVSVDKDWDNENYIGTPSIYPVLTGTTTTASNTTYTTTTTTSFSVSSSLVTTLEYYGNDMFTDIIKDIDDFTIQFENHGKYRFLSSFYNKDGSVKSFSLLNNFEECVEDPDNFYVSSFAQVSDDYAVIADTYGELMLCNRDGRLERISSPVDSSSGIISYMVFAPDGTPYLACRYNPNSDYLKTMLVHDLNLAFIQKGH